MTDDDQDDSAPQVCRFVQLPSNSTPTPAPPPAHTSFSTLRSHLIGLNESITTPFGLKRLVYCDWTASGRALRCVEDYLQASVLPLYANTHSSASKSALQTSCFRHEAREIVQLACNANRIKDVVLFTGYGATAAVNKLVHVLGPSLKQAVVFVGPFEHHSNLLPWRESGAKVVTVRSHPDRAGLDQEHLEQLLEAYAGTALKIGAFSACSNVTGICEDVDAVSVLVHRFQGLVFWDYSACAAYVKIDMNPVLLGQGQLGLGHKDAVFFSPHKFVGGVGANGVLIAKKSLFALAQRPSMVGGGTVLFVDKQGHRYLSDRVEREEAGSPDAVGSIRAGLAMQVNRSSAMAATHFLLQVKAQAGLGEIERRDAELTSLAWSEWAGVDELVVLGPKGPRLPVFSFLVRFQGTFLHHGFVAALLNDLYGIQARAGCMCAGPYVQQLLGLSEAQVAAFEREMLEHDREHLRPGVTRLSLHFSDSQAHAEFVLRAVRDVARHGWRLLPMYRYAAATGEWGHVKQFGKFPERRWLHNADLFGERRQQQQQREVDSYEATLCAALEVMRTPLGDCSHVPEPDDNPLRWFALPKEALMAVRGGSQHFTSRFVLSPNSSSSASNDSPWPLVVAVSAPPSAEPGAAPRHAPSLPSRVAKHPRRSASLGDEPALPLALPPPAHSLSLFPRPPKDMLGQVVRASKDWKMLQPNDRVLLGLSGGKDSLALLHILLHLQRRMPFKITLAACTVDPGTDAFDPSPLIPYLEQLGVEYFYERTTIFDDAKKTLPPGAQSYCSYCARMKRGVLYRVAREHEFNVLALAQHLDDFAESFVMSAFRNGQLRTMKANYVENDGSVRVIRPLCYVREKDTKAFSYASKLPVISENCPACFQPAAERARIKQLLKQEEAANPVLFGSLRKALVPLMGSSTADDLLKTAAAQVERDPEEDKSRVCVETCEV